MDFKLRPEQARTVAWMSARENGEGELTTGTVFGGILADEVGSGKTFAVIGLMLKAPMWPTLIVVPKSLVWQWTRLLSAAGIRDVCAITSRSASSVGRAACCNGVVVATLGVIQEEPIELVGRTWDRVVIDEAHCAKNPRTKTHRVLKNLLKKSHAKWAITATPIQNHEGDLLSLAALIGLPNCDVGLARTFVRAKEDVRAEARLDKEDDDAAHAPTDALPPLEIRTVTVDLDRPGEAELYDLAASAFPDTDAVAADDTADPVKGDKDRQSSSSRDFERMLRCRLAATHPALYYRSISRKNRGVTEAERTEAARLADVFAACPAAEVSSKLLFLSAELSSRPGEKTVVFCDWLEEMRLVEAEIVRSGAASPGSVHMFHGGLSVDERDEVISAFAADVCVPGGDASVLIAQIKCAGVGLNLQFASRAFLMRPQWNPSIEHQAVGRLHRSGQTRPVTVFRLVAAATVDEECLERQVHKLECIDRIMGVTANQPVVC